MTLNHAFVANVMRLISRCVLVIGWLGVSTSIVLGQDFAKDVLPILKRSCYECHGPTMQKSGYRLDVREVAIKGGDFGEAAIVPHDAKKSPLVRYVSGEDTNLTMPPKASGRPPLTPDEVALLRKWIDAGPAWPDELSGADLIKSAPHWSLMPLAKQTVPGGAAHPIDAFIQAKLAEEKIAPSPAADRRILICRVYFDLIGLPPSPDEVVAFAADSNPKAYENLVDKLLESPRYGERWARHWLDTIHFADSHGFEHDVGRDHAWRFRDYVISSLNRDTPWPRFIREQLAADVFYPDDSHLIAALGFLGAGTFDFSAYSTAPVAFDYLDRDDLVTQTMSAFVSTTANCARCHAHKFDPISQEDYYALQAVFSGLLKGDISYDADPTVHRQRLRWQSVLKAVEQKDATVLMAAEFEPLVESWIAQHKNGARWKPLVLETFAAEQGSTLTRTPEGIILSGGSAPERDTYTITAASPLERVTALKLDLHAHDSLPMRGPGRCHNGNLHLSEIALQVFEPDAAEARTVAFRSATADFNQTDWGIERALDGDLKTAWGIHPSVGQPHHAVFELNEPLTLKPGSHLRLSLRQEHGGVHLIGAFSLSVTDAAPGHISALPMEAESALLIPAEQRTKAQQLALAAHVLRTTATDAIKNLPAPVSVYAAAASVKVPTGNGTSQDRSIPEPKVVTVLHRGEFDKPRGVVEPGALSALAHLPARFTLKNPKSEAERRAALADWMAHDGNVLMWRSIVNRVWHWHFGRGLCDTPSDFGKMGGRPSHPELIDWLAVWFRDDAKASLKELHRLIVTSETYRQSSRNRDEAAAVDGDNRLLWRQNKFRLDADAFRDFTLAVSGKLDLTMGGPAIQHFTQSKGPQLTPVLDYAAYDWNSPGSGRRSIYRYVWRGIADPFMESLDFPDLGLLQPTRGYSASSLQALTLYNNPFVLHFSDAMARRLEAEEKEAASQIKLAVRLTWLREPTASEQNDFVSYAQTHGLAALCRLLLNSNEFLFVN